MMSDEPLPKGDSRLTERWVARAPSPRSVGINPNFWYPLARSHALKPGRALGVTFAGQPIVLVRTRAGTVFALEDRCAHRQVPLHLGHVSEASLICAYHGWRYDSSGRIAEIPGRPESVAAPSCIRSFPCQEAYKHIFVFPGAVAESAKVAFPAVANWDSPSYRVMYFSREVRCHYSFMHENLMDMNHQFLHRRLVGTIRPKLVDCRKGENWVEAAYRFERLSGRRPLGGRLLMKGGFDEAARAGGVGKGSRNGALMNIRTCYPYQTLEVYCPGSATAAYSVWAVYVPLDREQRLHRSFGMLIIRKPQPVWPLYLAWPIIRLFTELIFRQDRRMVEAEQRALEQQGGDRNHEIYPPILPLRELLARCGIPMSQFQAPLLSGGG